MNNHSLATRTSSAATSTKPVRSSVTRLAGMPHMSSVRFCRSASVRVTVRWLRVTCGCVAVWVDVCGRVCARVCVGVLW